MFASFVHGGNDVANSIAPLIALWLLFENGTLHGTIPNYAKFLLLLYGGIGIAVGMWAFGRRVIETLGQQLIQIRPSTGFTIEFGSALTVLVTTKMGVPVSTSHSKIGSIVFVGFADGKLTQRAPGEEVPPVNWGLMTRILASWVGTIPAAMGCSALYMFVFLKTIGE